MSVANRWKQKNVKAVPPDLFVNTPVLNCHAKTFLVGAQVLRPYKE